MMHIRLQIAYYNNEIDVFSEDPIMGALDRKNLTELKRKWDAGEIPEEEFRIDRDACHK